MEFVSEYSVAVSAVGVMALLLLIQVLVVDVVGLRSRHMPGSSIEANHDDLLFRVTRTVANSNESVAVFILAVLFCILSGASPDYSGYAAAGYVAARVAYAACYYSNLQTLRSVVFGLSLLFLAALIAVGALA